MAPPPGAGFGPEIGWGQIWGKRKKLVTCCKLSVFSRVSCRRKNCAKYHILVTPKPKKEKTRGHELADRVKSLERLRSQEAAHKGQIDWSLTCSVIVICFRACSHVFGWRARSAMNFGPRWRGNGLLLPKMLLVKRFLSLNVILSKGMTCWARQLVRKCTSVLWKRRAQM